MAQNFTDKLSQELEKVYNFKVTENGALGYATTGKKLLDVSFKLSSYRNASEKQIIKDFFQAMSEDPLLATKFLFFARDIRGGAGERRYFRVILQEIGRLDTPFAKALIPLVGNYGRFDDLLCLYRINDDLDAALDDYIAEILASDYQNALANKSLTLLAKWLPSFSTNDKHKRWVAVRLIKNLFDNDWEMYVKFLSFLRGKLDIVERKMTNGQWGEIDYSKVPSVANMKYNKAFFKHDKERRLQFIEALSAGKTKINAGTLFPHDIVHRMTDSNRRIMGSEAEVATLEALWAALPRKRDIGNTLVIQDGSGSMVTPLDTKSYSGPMAIDVSVALAIYFAEMASGEFNNKFVTFSNKPKIVNMQHCTSLRYKVLTAMANNDCSNTNIEAVFRMILVTAVQNRMAQKDLPENILVISDMEFDAGRFGAGKRLFDEVGELYRVNGYTLPRLVFWNVSSRTGTIPVISNELGVVLVSGFSPSVVQMILNGKTDPYEALKELLNSERYQPVEEIMRNTL